MIPNQERWSIILLGFWNPMIFTPQWLKDRLTSAEKIFIEIAVNNPLLSQRFGFDDIFLLVQANKLSLSPQNIQEATLNRLQAISTQILTALPETPLQAIGINFQFIEKEPTTSLLKLFDIADTSALADEGFLIKTTAIQRRLLIEDKIINLTAQLTESDHVEISFNFHRDIKDANEAKSFLDEGIINLKSKAIKILQSVYAIELDSI